MNRVQKPTSSKEVEIWVGSENPEAIMVPSKGLNPGPFGHVPHPDALILRIGEDKLLAWMEDSTGHIVVVAATRVKFPSFGFWNIATRRTVVIRWKSLF